MPLQLVAIKATVPVLDTKAFLAAATAAVRDTQAEGVRLMATYPPQWPNSRYRRTGTLKRSWHTPPVQQSGNAIVGEIASQGQIAPYNEKVQGMAQDPFFRQRGWTDVEDLVKLVRKELPPRVQAAVDKSAKGGKV